MAPSPPPSTFPPTPTPSRSNWTIPELDTPALSIMGIATPSRRVLATALRPPLQVSHTRLEFSLPSGYFDLGIESGAGRAQGCMFVNNSDSPLSWTLHTQAAGPHLEDGTFKFLHRTGSPFTPSSARKKSTIPSISLESGETFQLGVLFTPPRPGLFIAHVPVILNDDRDHPYRIIELRGELHAPSLTFEPAVLTMTPVPLETPVTANFCIVAKGYRKTCTVSCEAPTVEMEDGSLQNVLDVCFPDGRTIKPCCVDSGEHQDPCVIPCRVTFQSPSPVSFSAMITFTDGKDRYDLPISATADNCLLTCFHFLSQHQTDYHVVCANAQQANVQEKDKGTEQPVGEPVFKPCVTPNRPATIASTSATSTSFGISTSTYQESSNSESASTFQSTPQPPDDKGAAKEGSEVSEDRTTYTLDEPAAESKEKQFISTVVLAIQRTQGALLAHVTPENLLSPEDYKRWRRIQRGMRDTDAPLDEEIVDREMAAARKELSKFNSVSRRAWTDVLAQIIKVLVLSRVTPQLFKKVQSPFKELPPPAVNPNPQASNVYSVGERILLAWINHHYDAQRQRAWPGSLDGASPSCRWIVNFEFDFMDGLVLAALLAAYVPFLHIVVLAQVVTVDLELSAESLTVKPCPCMLSESGLQGSISLINKRNYPAEFSWAPVPDGNGTAFSIRPSQGTVDAFTNLVCQVTYMPTYSAPDETIFQLHVTMVHRRGCNASQRYSSNNTGRETMLCKGTVVITQEERQCFAKVGSAHCAFVERRLLFGPVALNLTTTKSVSIKNTGQNHAYFEVVDTHPIRGMVIVPKEGVVPVGGSTELVVHFSPDTIHKFDTHIQVNVRGGKMISLRVGGTVEPPCVDIDVVSNHGSNNQETFRLGGVYCGALATAPFTMRNMTRTRAELVLDMSRYMDFTLKFLDADEDEEPIYRGDGIYCLALEGQQSISCALEFSPSEVAAYDFIIPVSINNIMAPSPPPSTFPPTPTPSRSNWTIPELDTPAPSIMGIATPSRRVLATALRPPLQVSHTRLEFSLPSGYFDLGIESGAGRAQGCMFVNNSDSPLSWTLHTQAAGPHLEDGTFKFLHRTGSPFTPSSARKKSTIPSISLESGETFQLGVLFTPPRPGLFIAHVPVILNDDRDHPYRIIELRGELHAPSLTFEPAVLTMTPVPLETPVTANFCIVAKGYRKTCTVSCEAPAVEMEDGSLQNVLDVCFPDGQTIKPCCVDSGEHQDPCVIPCRITFQSPSPVSFSAMITFTDGKDRYDLPISATADNCLLTCFHFLSQHQTDYHVVCAMRTASKRTREGQGHRITVGEWCATSTSFGISTSTYQESSNSESASTFQSTPQPPDDKGAAKEGSEVSEDRTTYTLDEPAAESKEKQFISTVVLAIQRWFSIQGWAGGPFPISIPHSLSAALQDMSEAPSGNTAATRTTNWDSNNRKEMRSVFDLVTHLCGRQVPGIPLASALPTDPHDRVRQIHWMYATLLTFL
ncbi:predicted protein, partial [Nematostella vectensis]